MRHWLLGVALTAPVVACGSREQADPSEPAARSLAQPLGVASGSWLEIGPAPVIDPFARALDPQTGAISGANSGATNTVIPHPTNPDIVYAAATGGGIWRTQNATQASPHWLPLTDALPSTSTGALAMDPTNPLVLAAGTGTYSLNYGDPVGGRVYVTADGGATFLPPIEDPALVNNSITAIHVHDGIVLAGNDGGLFRNANVFASGGGSFTRTSIPSGHVYAIVSDPTNAQRVYAASRGNGIFRSEDGGATWARLPAASGGTVSNDHLRSATQNGNIDNEHLAVSGDGRLYLAVAITADLAFIGRSDDHGETWTELELPKFPFAAPGTIAAVSLDADGAVVVHASGITGNDTVFSLGAARMRITRASTGSTTDYIARRVANDQFTLMDLFTGNPIPASDAPAAGDTWQPWFSVQAGGGSDKEALAVDPRDSNVIYVAGAVGGDKTLRGDAAFVPTQPNAIPSQQWTGIVNAGTTNNTFPHDDPLGMAVAANGALLQGCDGGVFRRDNPQGNGDWVTLNTDLGTTQMHDVAVDPLTGLSLAGLQDNGTPVQHQGAGTTWTETYLSDGADVLAVQTGPATSERFFGSPGMDVSNHKTFDATGNEVTPLLQPVRCFDGVADGTCTQTLSDVDGGRFVTRTGVNKAWAARFPGDPLHLVVGGDHAVYESVNEGADFVSLLAGPDVQNFAYGNPNDLSALWAETQDGTVLRRLGNGSFSATTPVPVSPNGPIKVFSGDVVMTPASAARAYVALKEQVFFTPDGGATWGEVTGDLAAHSFCGISSPARARNIFALEYVPSPRGDLLLAGTEYGVFAADVDNPGVWTQVGSNLPKAVVADLDYQPPRSDGSGDALVAGTYGRGAWKLANASTLNHAPELPAFSGRSPEGLCNQTVRIAADASCQASVTAATLGSGAVDPDGDPLTLDLGPAGPYGLGTHCTTFTASDDHGASAACQVTIDVVDAMAPRFTQVPGDVTTTRCVAPTLGTATATDACGAASVTNNAPAKFPPGTTLVTWTARDAAGNTTTATQRVTVVLGDDATCCPAGSHVVRGTSGNDTLIGTAGPDCILGLGGQDTINGLGGDDFISGGDGDDIIDGGSGNNVIFGGTGQDRITGGTGVDFIDGGDGDDTINGGSGNDSLHGGNGQDALSGGDGDDQLFGDAGDDRLDGGNGNDTLVGGGLHDTCNGGTGANTFTSCQSQPDACVDHGKDGTETDVDCGGSCSLKCSGGRGCVSSGDCQSGACIGGACGT